MLVPYAKIVITKIPHNDKEKTEHFANLLNMKDRNITFIKYSDPFLWHFCYVAQVTCGKFNFLLQKTQIMTRFRPVWILCEYTVQYTHTLTPPPGPRGPDGAWEGFPFNIPLAQTPLLE